MSSSSKEKSGKKKKDVWQEAGGEFYQEQYPCGSGQATSNDNVNETTQRRVPRPHIPLPSLTARRNSFIPTGRNKFTRKQSLNTNTVNATFNATNCMTYTSTMAGGAATVNGNDVHVALMPDLADETIPNEKVTYEAIQKIRVLTEPMGLKRIRKAKIAAIPKLRLHGWRMIKWELRKAFESFKFFWIHYIMTITLFGGSIRKIEHRNGTSISNVFIFIKWVLFLNLATSTAIIGIILYPYYNEFQRSLEDITTNSSCKQKFAIEEVDNYDLRYTTINERSDCCTEIYHTFSEKNPRGSLGLMIKLLFYADDDNASISIETSPFFYGYYIHDEEGDEFAFRYVGTITGILLVNLLLMVKTVGIGIKDMIRSGEGGFYKYSNLVFSGWDHYTIDDVGAKFKKKIIHHEMKVVLQTEKRQLEELVRNRRERIKLGATRVLANIAVLGTFCFAAVTIYYVSGVSIMQTNKRRSFDKTQINEHLKTLGLGFAPSVLISVYNLLFPIVLEKVGRYERYSKQKETALLLVRALFVRLLSIGFAAFRFYTLTYCQPEDNPSYTLKKDPLSLTCIKCLDSSVEFRNPCWESLFADQIYKLMFVDISIKLLLTFFIDPIRMKLKSVSRCKFCQTIGTINFNIVRHSLDMIYIQLLSWLGIYFGPVIPILVVIYCVTVFYTKKYSVLYNCTAVPDTFKTIRTTTMYVVAKLLSFVAVLLANTIVIGFMVPSRECGPLRSQLGGEYRPWKPVLNVVRDEASAYQIYQFIVSSKIAAPVVLILILFTYYYYSVAQANRALVDTLRHLLVLEGHDKQYLFARLNSLRRPSTGSRSRGSTILETRNSRK